MKGSAGGAAGGAAVGAIAGDAGKGAAIGATGSEPQPADVSRRRPKRQLKVRRPQQGDPDPAGGSRPVTAQHQAALDSFKRAFRSHGCATILLNEKSTAR